MRDIRRAADYTPATPTGAVKAPGIDAVIANPLREQVQVAFVHCGIHSNIGRTYEVTPTTPRRAFSKELTSHSEREGLTGKLGAKTIMLATFLKTIA